MANPFSKLKDYYKSGTRENLYVSDGAVPFRYGIGYGLIHVMAMFLSNIAPALIVLTIIDCPAAIIDNAIRSSIFFAGIGTAIQLFPIWRIGSKLPVFIGTSFTFIGLFSSIIVEYGIGTLFIAIIVGGVLLLIHGLVGGRIHRIIKPIVSALVVLGLGLSLIQVSINDLLSVNVGANVLHGQYQIQNAWPYLIVGFSTLTIAVLWQAFISDPWKGMSLIVSLVLGYIIALCFPGMIDFSKISFSSVTDFINVPRPIFVLQSFSMADFKIGPIISVAIIYYISSTEIIGAVSATTNTAFSRDPTNREISGAISGIGFVSALAGAFGAMPFVVYSQGAGIIGQNKVINRFALLTGAIFLIVASFLPPISAIISTVPSAVIGGALLYVFASIALSGVKMIVDAGLNKKNIFIAAITLGLGFGITLVPSIKSIMTDNEFAIALIQIITNPVATMFLISLPLSYLIPDSYNK